VNSAREVAGHGAGGGQGKWGLLTTMEAAHALRLAYAPMLALQTVLSAPGALVLLVSPSERQSGELFRKCLAT